MKRLMLFLVLALMLLASTAFSQTTTVKWKWTMADGGAEVVAYEGRVQIADFSTPGADTMSYTWASTNADTSYTMDEYTYGTSVRLMVRGKDAKDRVGPYSQWSEWFIDWGMPGMLGTPIVIEVGGEAP